MKTKSIIFPYIPIKGHERDYMVTYKPFYGGGVQQPIFLTESLACVSEGGGGRWWGWGGGGDNKL